MTSAHCMALILVLLGQSQAYPIHKSPRRPLQSTWLDLFAPDGSIKKDRLDKFPLYEYVYEDIDYGEQIWTDCGEVFAVLCLSAPKKNFNRTSLLLKYPSKKVYKYVPKD